ncbi:MAG TPA: Mur ligase family protein [Sphingobacterium sp.]|nr:Mur ligase family protein [Sphingobacterium sp.]
MKVHFIAIGGSVMSNLAVGLAKLGHQVTGSDDQIVEPSKTQLQEAGLLPQDIGWYVDKITDDLDAVILGKHALADNPELLRAQKLGLKIYSFPEFIYEQSIHKTRVVIAGTYGKTTIISMIMHVLKKMGKEFDYLVGAKLEGFDSLIRLTSTAPVMLIEGDEFYASSIDKHAKFHYYHPNIALISNIHWDNFEVAVSEEEYLGQFELFIQTIVSKGALIYNKDDENVVKVVDKTKDQKINRHGYKLPLYTINKGITYVQVGNREVPLQIIGKQNLSNIAGAYTVCEWLGVKQEEFFEAIKDFKSSIRYLEFVSSANGSVVYQDFAHTPPKLKASIHAVKEQFPVSQLLTIIELNPYEMTDKDKVQQYKGSMDESDWAVVFLNKNSIKEKNILLKDLVYEIEQIFDHPNLRIMTSTDDLYAFLEGFESQGVNMLFMSSDHSSGLNMLNYAKVFL